MNHASDILTTVQGPIGHVHLNRPAKINALTPAMIGAVRQALATWRNDTDIVAILIDGAGERGLCAGGDIAAVYDAIQAATTLPDDFWGGEYQMNLEIAQYPKPIVAVMHGITFGGGIGIAAHASVRIVTESSQLAMPETAIGLSPDVGGLYLLARAPGESGTHAALTGARLGAGDAIAAGLADYFVPQADLPGALQDLMEVGAEGDVIPAVQRYSAMPPAPEWVGAAWIDECYRGDDAGTILARLRAHDDPAARDAGDLLGGMSPTAIAVTLEAIRRAATMTLAEVLHQDLVLSMAFARHPDFPEGIRAQIIDKDRNPRWNPAALVEVRQADVAAFFN